MANAALVGVPTFMVGSLALGFNLAGWFGLGPAGTDEASTAAFLENVANTQKTFLLAWLVLIVILTLVTLRLPSAFTLLFLLVDAALLFVFLGVKNADEGLVKTGGYFVLSFVVVGAYLFADAMSAATGGKNLPLGPPILK